MTSIKAVEAAKHSNVASFQLRINGNPEWFPDFHYSNLRTGYSYTCRIYRCYSDSEILNNNQWYFIITIFLLIKTVEFILNGGFFFSGSWAHKIRKHGACIEQYLPICFWFLRILMKVKNIKRVNKVLSGQQWMFWWVDKREWILKLI